MWEPARHARHASHASHDSESCEPRWRVNMRITQLLKAKALFKRRTLHVPNLMQMSENNRFFSFAVGSAHVKFDV